ncbi:RHS repeat domain-containing protein [Myroides odoratus]|uniref:RHS repeat-associated core domain n=1 Tax=Myroides odoratus TaxID=256 RepID=A0A378RJZ5_MYROD|nr:RHS repeat-associated core domain-containing protein [Myroides odoratus]QQU05213.1 RHS repeat-associated core domain-containing protein [Myroides odoratus]STZ27295.1 RHS repeat-associated core domain [Myroides odoratus]
MKDFFTQSQNFIGSQQTGIDPRTGAFTLNLPLATLNANYGMGPEVSLSLASSSLNQADEGFGIGFGFGLPFTTYDYQNQLLRLSTGEQYLVEDDSDDYQGELVVKQKKLNNFIFERFNGDDDQEGYYKVTYKSGLVEILDSPSSSYSIKNTVSIQTYEGHAVYLKWMGDNARLISIADDHHTLVEISYFDLNAPVVSVFPGEEEAYEIQFTLGNGKLEEVKQVQENYTWFLYYTAQGFIKEIKHPTGLIETIDYQFDVFRFPDNVYPALPAAVKHRRSPGNGQPDLVSSFKFNYSSQNNYLGYQEGIGGVEFESNRDNLYAVMSNYFYDSEEVQTQDNLTIKTVRTYNNFHLNTRELTSFYFGNQTRSIQVDLEYYAIIGIPFEYQPNQFQLVKEKTTTWRDSNGTRQEVHLTEFDTDGNPTLEIQPNGSQTTMTWYDADGERGCPAEPHGFVRFLKESITIPNQDDYDTPIQMESYTYTNLGDSDLIVAEQLSKYSDDELLQTRFFEYEQDSSSLDYGRMTFIHDKLYADGAYSTAYDSYQAFEFTVDDDEITQETIFTGHDGCEAATSSTSSAFTHRVLSQISAQGVVSSYSYDSMGRILRSTQAEGTAYESSTYWEYELTSSGPVTHYTDALDNQAKVYFDGLGRELRKYGLDRKGSGQWEEILSQDYNAAGQSSQKTVRDVQTSNNRKVTYSIRTNISYDGWGQMMMLQFANGIKAHQEDNPVWLTSSRWQSGGSMRSGEWKKTMHYKSQLLEKEERINLQGQVVGTKLYAWDGLGRLREEIDELGHSVERTYDAYGRVLTQTLQDGTTLEYTYVPYLTGSEIARIEVSSSDGNWVLGEQEFDSLGRLLEQQTGGRTTSYDYEDASPVPSTVTQPDGTTIEYAYIAELGNAITQIETDDLTQAFEYDSTTGALIESAEGMASNQNYWNDYGLLETETLTVNGDAYDMDYQWTLRGEPASHSDITGAQTQYERDEHGRVSRIVDQDVTADLFYDALGRLDKKIVEDNHSYTKIETEFEYNEFDQALVEIIKDSKGTQLRLERSWLSNGLLNSQVTKLNGNSIKEEDYAYDVRNRLVEYSISGSEFPKDGYGQAFRKQIYEYDALNNLVTVETTLENYQVDVAEYHYENHADPTQLTSVTHSHGSYPATIELEYDTCGRMTVDEAGRNLSYDAFGRLVELEGPQDSTYQYNANNQLVNQTVAGDQNCQLYYRAGELVNQVLVEEDKKVRWIKSGATCLAVNDDQDVTLTASGQNESLLWSVKNSDSQGELHQYGAYGQGEAEEDLPAFNGERKDPISGHYHLGNGYRSYSPVLMRFTCPDSMSPFGAGGINAYAYCAGDPINFIDPSGHSAMGTAGLFSGGVISQGLAQLGAVGGIALGIIGIVSAVATFGASVAGMGVAMASISLTLSLAAEATGIASIAVGNSDPELSAKLGWASLGLGIAGSATGAYSKPKTGAPLMMSKQNILSDSFTEGSFANEEIYTAINRRGQETRIHILTAENYDIEKSNTVILFAHGGPLIEERSFTSSSSVGFYANRGELHRMDLLRTLKGRQDLGLIRDRYMPNTSIPNQLLTAPYLPMKNHETGMKYYSSKEVALDSIRTAMNEHPNSFPHAVAVIGTEHPVPIGSVIQLLEKDYKNIYVACCRRLRTT